MVFEYQICLSMISIFVFSFSQSQLWSLSSANAFVVHCPMTAAFIYGICFSCLFTVRFGIKLCHNDAEVWDCESMANSTYGEFEKKIFR